MSRGFNTVFSMSRLLKENSAELIIPSGYFNGGGVIPFVLSNDAAIERIVIGDGCFAGMRVFELNGLSKLESVVIGEKSFRISDRVRTDGACRITNCPKLKSIQIGNRSFSDYSSSFELSNLPSLQSIDIGEYCFFSVKQFSLTGLID